MIVFAVFKTDNWHSHASKDLIGIAVDGNPLRIIEQQVAKEGEELSDDDYFNIANLKQTQNYEGEGEFFVEPIEADTLI